MRNLFGPRRFVAALALAVVIVLGLVGIGRAASPKPAKATAQAGPIAAADHVLSAVYGALGTTIVFCVVVAPIVGKLYSDGKALAKELAALRAFRSTDQEQAFSTWLETCDRIGALKDDFLAFKAAYQANMIKHAAAAEVNKAPGFADASRAFSGSEFAPPEEIPGEATRGRRVEGGEPPILLTDGQRMAYHRVPPPPHFANLPSSR